MKNYLIAMSFCAAMLVPAMASAIAPVTFQFEAEITEIKDPSNIVNTLSFGPTLGQPIAGVMTFTPVPFGQTGDPTGRLGIELGGEFFAANSLSVISSNNVSYIAGNNFYGPNDGISISCEQNGVCVDAESSATEISLRYLGLGVTSRNLDVVDEGTIIDKAEVWNRLPARTLVFKVSTDANLSPVTITASVGQMFPVPEPSSYLLVGSILTTLALSFRRSY